MKVIRTFAELRAPSCRKPQLKVSKPPQKSKPYVVPIRSYHLNIELR